MTTTDTASLAKYLDMFPAWLRGLGEDAKALGEVVDADGDDGAKRYLASGLNYIFKSLDLIPDGIDDLGFCDDAFVLRVAAALAVADQVADQDGNDGIVGRLAGEAKSVEEFLGEDYPRLVAYVENLRKGAARGRTVEDIVTDEGVRRSFVREITAWSEGYEAPSFTRDVKTLIKLKAFLNAKLA